MRRRAGARCAPGRADSDGSSGLLGRRLGRRSEHRRANPLKSCTSMVSPLLTVRSGGRWARPIVRCFGPGPVGVARPVAGCPPMSRHRPEGPIARDPPVPRAPLRSRDRRRAGADRGAPVRRHRRGAARVVAGAEPAQRGPARPPVRRAGRGSRRALPAGRADVRRVALGRSAAQGPQARGLRLRAGLRGPGHRDRAHPARLLRPPEARAVRARGRGPPARAHARGCPRGPLPAPARDRRQHVARRGPVRGSARARPRRTSRRSRRPRRRSTSSTTTACATACGS